MNNVTTKYLAEVLCPLISGNRPKGGVSTETEGVPSLGGENILFSGGVTYDVIKRIPKRFFDLMPKGRLRSGDVLINKDGAQTGKVGYYVGDLFDEAAINEHLFILRGLSDDIIEQSYLYYSLLLPETQRKIERRITGSAQPGLNSSFVRAVDIPYHDADVQEDISRILRTIDAAIEKTESIIAKYQQIKAGLMHDLFTRGVTADGKLRPPREQAPELYHETPIGWIPKEWSIGPLSSCTQHDITYGIVQAGPHIEGGIPYIRTGDMAGDRLERSQLLCTSPTIAAAYKRSEVRAGEIVCAIRATVGKVLEVPSELDGANLTQGTARLSPSTDIDRRFLLWVMRSSGVQRSISQRIKGTTFSEITLGELRSLPIPRPSMRVEQTRIGERLDEIDSFLQTEKAVLTKLLSKKSGLMHDLLTGKVRVIV